MREENKRMQTFLKANGIDAVPKYLFKGSLKGSWRLYGTKNGNTHDLKDYQKWTPELAQRLTDLGFRGLFGPLDQNDGNGGVFSIFVRGHNEFLKEVNDEPI